MVLQQENDARRQRILKKREQAKQEYIEQQRLRESEEKKNKTKEESRPETANSDEEVERGRKKPRLDVLDSKTMISNVYHYLNQEYKYLQLRNDNDPDLRPLAAITQRTSEATGVTRSEVRTIVREERAKRTEKRKAESQKQRITANSGTERKDSAEGDGPDNYY